ncbi:type II toxin-antitoxin system HicA family toxin [soil metagenome]
MPPLPVVSAKKATKVFESVGWRFYRQKGSHMIFKKRGAAIQLAIPNHKELGAGLLRGLIRDSGLSVEEFVNLL